MNPLLMTNERLFRCNKQKQKQNKKAGRANESKTKEQVERKRRERCDIGRELK